MIAKKEIEKLPVIPVTAHGREEFVGRARMHGDALVLDVYDARRVMAPEGEEKGAEISFRWACDKKNYYTYSFGNLGGEGRWSTRRISFAAYGVEKCFGEENVRLDGESEHVVREFLEDYEEDGWRSGRPAMERIGGLESDIRTRKGERSEVLRESRLRARLAAREPLPKDWEKWLQNHVFQGERYVFYDGKKRKSGICAHCGVVVTLSGRQRHGDRGKCPSCKSKVRYMADGRRPMVREKANAVYLQKTPEGFLARYFTVRKKSSMAGERYETEEEVFATYDGRRTWYDFRFKPKWWRGDRYWQDTRSASASHWKPEGHLYTRNVRTVLKGTRFQYAPLVEWARHERGEIPVGPFLSRFEHSPFLEFFIKAGLFRLTREYVDSEFHRWSGNGPREVLKIGKRETRRLARLDGGIRMLEWMQYGERKGINITDEELAWLEENEISYGKCKDVLGKVGSVKRMMGYVKRQGTDPYATIGTWTDYMRMAEEVGMDATDDIVRFPKELRMRHDQLVELRNREADMKRLKSYEPLDREIRGWLPQAARYYWQDDEYIVVPAAKCGELMAEGRSLHHCVGASDRYMKKMAKGEAWILFLRKKKELKTPWYTIEIDMADDEILQWYSAYDRKPDKEVVEKVLKKFSDNVRSKREKEQRQARVKVPMEAMA